MTLSSFMVESIFFSTLLFFYTGCVTPPQWSRVTSPPPFSFIEDELLTLLSFMDGDGKKSRSDSLLLYGREYPLLHHFLL